MVLYIWIYFLFRLKRNILIGDGLKEDLATDYYFAETMAAIALIPLYFSDNLIFVQHGPGTSQCALEFRRGLDRLYDLCAC